MLATRHDISSLLDLLKTVGITVPDIILQTETTSRYMPYILNYLTALLLRHPLFTMYLPLETYWFGHGEDIFAVAFKYSPANNIKSNIDVAKSFSKKVKLRLSFIGPTYCLEPTLQFIHNVAREVLPQWKLAIFSNFFRRLVRRGLEYFFAIPVESKIYFVRWPESSSEIAAKLPLPRIFYAKGRRIRALLDIINELGERAITSILSDLREALGKRWREAEPVKQLAELLYTAATFLQSVAESLL